MECVMVSSKWILATVALWWCVVVNPALGAANLDALEPVVKVSPVGEAADEFGYSVLLHRVSSPLDSSIESFLASTRLIVGAPQGTYPGGLPLPADGSAENNTGLVYECPVGRGGCGRIGNITTPLFDGSANRNMENKTGQRMGAMLYSRDNFFIACAPLYVVFSIFQQFNLDDSRPVGRCYVSSRDLQQSFSSLQPCDGNRNRNPSSTINSQQQCLAGFSATVLPTNNTHSSLVVAAPGSSSFSGNLFYYASPTSTSTKTMNSDSNDRTTYQYEGFSTTVGDVTALNSQDVISGAPRWDGATLFGSVLVRPRNSITQAATIQLNGTQTGEYFGAAVVAADLNHDGFDEVIVGAPIYSSGRIQESGRVYVFRNIDGVLNSRAPTVLEGPTVQSRFGTSIVNLGDINGDSMEDIAIGAPYEGYSATSSISGAVYIHYGSNTSEIISTTSNQVIRAQNIIDTVPGITNLQGFGFSLSSGVDVDGNEFNDLLVGAHISGAAVLFRALSVANIEILNITSSTKTILLDAVGSDGTSFTVTVCARYTGRGFSGRPLTINMTLAEVPNGPSRVFFSSSNKDVNTAVLPFRLISTDSDSCVDVLVYSKSLLDLSRRSDIYLPLELRVSFSSMSRPSPEYVSGGPRVLADLRDTPILTTQGNNSILVFPSVNCSGEINGEEVCISDLTVSLNSTVFLDSQNNAINRDRIVAELVQTVRIDLDYFNMGKDPALGSEILFTLPEGFIYSSASVPVGSQDVTCQEDNSLPRVFTCLLANYIPPQAERLNADNSRLSILWRVSRTLVGNEEPQMSNVSIRIAAVDGSRSAESNTTNNDLMNGPLMVMYEALADLDLSSLTFTITAANYRRNIMIPDNPTVNDIGRAVELKFMAVNRGPSTSLNTRLEVFIPTNDTLNSFYLYLTNATAIIVDSETIVMDCDFSGINPQNLLTSSSNRRKRSVLRRQESASSEAVTILSEVVRNCSDPTTRSSKVCTSVSCNIPSFAISQRVEVTVRAALDYRFFNTQSDPFIFVAYGSITSRASFVSDPNPFNNEIETVPYRASLFIPPARVAFPFWIIIVIGVVILILLIVVFIILYCCGCFRRKHIEDKEEGISTLKVTAINPKNGTKENVIVGGTPDSIKKTDYDHNDIGDASDLQDDDSDQVDANDPSNQAGDETSL